MAGNLAKKNPRGIGNDRGPDHGPIVRRSRHDLLRRRGDCPLAGWEEDEGGLDPGRGSARGSLSTDEEQPGQLAGDVFGGAVDARRDGAAGIFRGNAPEIALSKEERLRT